MFAFVVVVSTIIANALIAFVLFKNNYRSASNILIAFLALIIIFWTIFTHLALESTTEASRLFFVRLVMFITVPFGPLIYFLARSYPDKQFKSSTKSVILISLLIVIVSLISLSPLSFKELVNKPDGSFILIPGLGIIAYGVMFLGFMSAGILILVRKYRSYTGIKKQQLRFFLAGLLVSCTLLTITNFLAVVLAGSISLTRFGPPATLIMLIAITYAIVKHRLFDIRGFISRSIGFSLSIILLVLIYAVSLLVLQQRILKVSVTSNEVYFSMFWAVLVAISIQPIYRTFIKFTNKIFYKDNYDSQNLLYQTSAIIASTLLLEDLSRGVLTKLVNTIGINHGIVILTEGNQVYQVVSKGYQKNVEIDEQTIKELMSGNKDLIYEELEDGDDKEIMNKNDFRLVLQLIKDGEDLGIIAFGEKLSGDIYTEEDLRVLSIASSEMAVAIVNAKAYEEIRRFNITLEDEIDAATSKLVAANKKLQELDKLKDEFVSIASHELRTPMVSIKNYIWMTLAGKGGKLARKQKFYLDRAYKSANRMSKLINDLLNISRIESGRIILNVERMEIGSLVEQIVDEFKPKSEEVGVPVTIECPDKKQQSIKELPEVIIDKDKIAEVLTNLIGNALKFTPEKGKVRVCLFADKSFVTIQVIDSGVGLDKEQMSKLFKKFGMLKESYASQGDAAQGTGLGLYICKSIVELHGGEIGVESEGHGKGSTFSFSVPVYTEGKLKKLQKKFDDPNGVGIVSTTQEPEEPEMVGEEEELPTSS